MENKKSYKKWRPEKRRKTNSNRPAKSQRNKESKLENGTFVKKAESVEIKKFKSSILIKDLPVNQQLKNNLLEKGFINPTEIQERTLDSIAAGRNLMGIAKTGTGKTAAFLVPLLDQLIHSAPAFQVLIIVPTRELALQIEKELKGISNGLRISSKCFIGGTNVSRDKKNLRAPSHVIIGTPGRLLDLSNQKVLKFGNFTHLVLDEFDRLLDMGFATDIQKIVSQMKKRQQTVLFSATEEANQKTLIGKLLNDPVEVRVSNKNETADNIDQEIVKVKEGESKMGVLVDMIRDDSFKKVIVFAETKRWVSKVCKELLRNGIKADQIHGNKSQNYRQKALNAFKTERIQVLVATDVAARGLDIDRVSHVVNYQKPKNYDSYIHRIGRTGRAGNSGKAFTFVN